MSGCNHYDGGSCVVCGINTNNCCGGDRSCYMCCEELCERCYKKIEKNGYSICPVCTLDIVPDEVLLDYLLEKYKLTKDSVTKDYQTKMGRNPIKESTQSDVEDSTSL